MCVRDFCLGPVLLQPFCVVLLQRCGRSGGRVPCNCLEDPGGDQNTWEEDVSSAWLSLFPLLGWSSSPLPQGS